MSTNADRRALKAGKYLSAFHQRKGGSMKKKNRIGKKTKWRPPTPEQTTETASISSIGFWIPQLKYPTPLRPTASADCISAAIRKTGTKP